MTVYTGFRPVLLADQARNAAAPGSCAECRYGIHTGQRIARLASGQWAHAWCTGSASPDRRRRGSEPR